MSVLSIEKRCGAHIKKNPQTADSHGASDAPHTNKKEHKAPNFTGNTQAHKVPLPCFFI